MIRLLGFLILFSVYSAQAETLVPIGLASNFSELSTVSFNPYGGYFRNGIHLALAKRSEELKAKGLMINLTEFDYGADDLNVIKTVKAANASSILAVIGYNYSSNALIAAPIHQKLKLPMLSPSASANRLSTFGKYIHLGSFNNDYMAQVLAKFALKELKAKKIVTIYAANCAYCSDLSQAFEKFVHENGGEIVKSLPVIQEDKAFPETAKALEDVKFDAVFIPNQELTAARVILSLLQEGIKKPFLGADGWGNEGSEFFKVLEDKSFEGYSVTHWHPDLSTPESQAFVRTYKAKYGRLPNDTSVLAYDFMNYLIDGILKTKELTREALESSLVSIKEMKGITGRYVFSAHKAPQKDILILKTSSKGFNIHKSYSLLEAQR